MDLSLLLEWIAQNGLPSAATVAMFLIWRKEVDSHAQQLKDLNERYTADYERMASNVVGVLERHTTTIGGLTDSVSRLVQMAEITEQIRGLMRGNHGTD